MSVWSDDLPVALPAEFTPPDYAGGSIANVPATLAGLFGVPFAGLPPLRRHLWDPLGTDVRRVVVILLDALGANLLAAHESLARPWRQQARVQGELTSVFPSTTVAALSSLWTGRAPAQHGLVGLHMLFPEYGAIGQLLDLSPTFGRYPDALVRAGLEPETFLVGPGLAEQLAAGGVVTHDYKGAYIVDSALSRMHGRGAVGQHGVHTFAEMMVRLREHLEGSREQTLLLVAYWPSLDTLSHAYTPFHVAVTAELESLFGQIADLLWEPLSPEARAGTALILMADHGQTATPHEAWIDLADHPHLRDLLLMRPAGEPRAAYLYCRQGQQADVLAYLQENLGAAAIALPAAAALEAGLFGPPPHAPAVPGRLGDVVAIMRANYSLIFPADRAFESRFVSRHGGMTGPEMNVPWLAFRLDDGPPPALDSRRRIR